MSIKITWDNFNIVASDSIVVYRSDSPITGGALPAPLATLAGDALEYTDTTAVRNAFYYYVVAAVKDGATALSPNLPFAFIPDTGPGPATLARGNWGYGYFGEVAIADFVTPAQLATATARSVTGAFTVWHKFAFKGKVLYTPNVFANTAIQWSALYSSGLIYGTNDNGAYPVGATLNVSPTNQLKRMAVGDGTHQCRIRIPTGGPLSPSQIVSNTTAAGTVGSEMDAICGLGSGSLVVDAFNHVAGGVIPTTLAWTQHWFSTSQVRPVVPLSLVGSNVATTANGAWIPVLELEPI